MFMPAKGFNKEFKQNIVQSYASHRHHKIADQLDSSPQVRTLENHVHAQVKANGKRNEKGHDKSRHVRLKGQHTHMQYLLVQHEVVKHVVKKNIEQRVATAAGCVVIGLNRHKPPEQGIKDVQHGKNGFSNAIVNLTHEGTNLNQIWVLKGLNFVKGGPIRDTVLPFVFTAEQ